MYLFDTDAISHIIKKTPSLDFIRRLSGVDPKYQFTTSITVGELVYGAKKSNRPDYFLRKLDRLVWPNIQVLFFDEPSAKTYGKLRATLEKSRKSVSEPAMRIASIALCHSLILITGNIKLFSKIPGLRSEDWLFGK